MIKNRIESLLKKINNEKITSYINAITENSLDSFEVSIKRNVGSIRNFLNKEFENIHSSEMKYFKILNEYFNMIDLGVSSFIEKVKLDKSLNESNVSFFYFLESFSNNYVNRFPDFVFFDNFHNFIKNYSLSPSLERYYKDFKVIYDSKKNKVKLFEYFNRIFLSDNSPVSHIVSEDEIELVERFILLGEGSKKEVSSVLENYSYFVPVREFIETLTSGEDLINVTTSSYDVSTFDVSKEIPFLLKEYKDGFIFNVDGNFVYSDGKNVSFVSRADVLEMDEEFVILSDYLKKERVISLNENIIQFKGANNKKITMLKNNNDVSIYIGGIDEDFSKKYDYDDLNTIILMNGNIFEGITYNNSSLLKYLRDSFLNGNIRILDDIILVKNKINESKSFFIIKVGSSYNFLIENELVKNKSLTGVRDQILKMYGFDIGSIMKESLSREELVLEELEKIKKEHLEKIENLDKRLNFLHSKKEFFKNNGLEKEYEDLVFEIEDLLIKLKRDGVLKEVEDMIGEIKFNGIQDRLENNISVGDIVTYKGIIGKVVESYGDSFLVKLENGETVVKNFLFLNKVMDVSKLDESSFSFIVGNKKVTIEDIDDEDDKDDEKDEKEEKDKKEKHKSEKDEKEDDVKDEKKSEKEEDEEKNKEEDGGEKEKDEGENKSEKSGEEEESLDDLLKI
jgi:hypothetical protein